MFGVYCIEEEEKFYLGKVDLTKYYNCGMVSIDIYPFNWNGDDFKEHFSTPFQASTTDN